MSPTLDPALRRALADRVRYYNELGIYDFYRRGPAAQISTGGMAAAGIASSLAPSTASQSETREEMAARKSAVVAPVADSSNYEAHAPKPEYGVTDPIAALKMIREDLGECTRCKLHKQGRKQIVFGVGNPRAELMFVGEGPGADEDAQGEPFVGRAGQLLNNMIKAMGLQREEIYIANVVKCRPPGNRTPEPDECDTCSPFLMRQIAAIMPKVVVALGATAAKNLLAMNSSLGELRGRFYDFKPAGVRSNDPAWPGARLAVTYHPAYLLRDPRQKGEAWKDLQMVMKYLGLKAPKPDA
ncbi:MAG: uracil-DNA glycosylase [Candidatus Sulfotelmatobacter sp.]